MMGSAPWPASQAIATWPGVVPVSSATVGVCKYHGRAKRAPIAGQLAGLSHGILDPPQNVGGVSMERVHNTPTVVIEGHDADWRALKEDQGGADRIAEER
jgi:hypothetical protein